MKHDLFEFQKNSFLGKVSGQPLCQEYKQLWKACGDDKEKLMKLALRQQSLAFVASACYNGVGLSKDYIKEHFREYINGYTIHDADGTRGYTYGMYVDWDYENDLEIKNDVTSIMWTVGANIVVPRTKAPVIYISNRSNVHLVGDGYNSINIKLFDDSKVTIVDADDSCNVTIFKYSKNAGVEVGKYCLAQIKEFDKELRI